MLLQVWLELMDFAWLYGGRCLKKQYWINIKFVLLINYLLWRSYFCFNYFKHINTVYVSDDCSYYYRQIENSLSNKIIDYRTVYKALKLHSIDYIYFQERYSDNFIINNYFASFILASGVLRIIEQIMNEVSISVKEKKNNSRL